MIDIQRIVSQRSDLWMWMGLLVSLDYLYYHHGQLSLAGMAGKSCFVEEI